MTTLTVQEQRVLQMLSGANDSYHYALRDVADAYSNRRALESELAHARASLAEGENAYRVIRVRYDAGLARYLDVLAVENLLLVQRTAVADFEAQAFAHDIALVRALGGGYVESK